MTTKEKLIFYCPDKEVQKRLSIWLQVPILLEKKKEPIYTHISCWALTTGMNKE